MPHYKTPNATVRLRRIQMGTDTWGSDRREINILKLYYSIFGIWIPLWKKYCNFKNLKENHQFLFPYTPIHPPIHQSILSFFLPFFLPSMHPSIYSSITLSFEGHKGAGAKPNWGLSTCQATCFCLVASKDGEFKSLFKDTASGWCAFVWPWMITHR